MDQNIIQDRLNKFQERYEFEIQIVDHCNLKCLGCNHFANIAEPWYMSKEEFLWSINKLYSAIGPKIKKLMIVGGEPTLHPLLKDFIEILGDTFKNTNIVILSNGIEIDKNPEYFLNLVNSFPNISYGITQYPLNHQYIYSEQNNKIGFLYPRLNFDWPQIDSLKKQKDSYSSCSTYVLPCFIIRDKKIFICPYSASIHSYSNKFNQNIYVQNGDYLDLNTFTEQDLIDFIKKGPQHICKTCFQKDRKKSFYWKIGENSLESYNQTYKDLYFKNYKLYKDLCLGNQIFEKISNVKNNNEFLINKLDKDCYLTGSLYYEYQRRFNTLIDIIIPYDIITEEMLNNLKTNLITQSFIDKCSIYFISDYSSYDSLVWKIFEDIPNVYFLKNEKDKGPGMARQEGIDNSFGRSIFLLDVDDLIFSFESLEVLYNNLLNNDCVFGKILQNDLNSDCMILPASSMLHGLLLNREFLNKNNIKFNNSLLYEDKIFFYQLKKYFQNIKEIDNIVYIYNRNTLILNKPNYHFIEIFLWEFLAFLEIYQIENASNINNQNLLIMTFKDLINNCFSIDLEKLSYFEKKDSLFCIIFCIFFILQNLFKKNINYIINESELNNKNILKIFQFLKQNYESIILLNYLNKFNKIVIKYCSTNLNNKLEEGFKNVFIENGSFKQQ